MMHDDEPKRKTLPVLPVLTAVMMFARLVLDFIRLVR